MSGWWSLPHAAPILLRHLGAYAELVEQDLAVAQRQFAARLLAISVIVFAALFTVMLICVAIVAATWDTAARMRAIYCMIGVFAVLLSVAIAYLARINAQSQSLLASVRREWAVDRVILDEILSGRRADGYPGHVSRAPGRPAPGTPAAGTPAAGNGLGGAQHAGGSDG
jgi:uncharacterized membrane protein YqjE